MAEERIGEVSRSTSETKIYVKINLDGSGQAQISTGIGFFDHMLNAFARHGLFDLTVKAEGDLYVDDHHTVEDTGIVLGEAIAQAAGDKKGICRYGDRMLPMDETLVLVALDLCGRPSFVWDAPFPPGRMGEMSNEMVREFFYAISYSAAMNLHMKVITPGNTHHMAEAFFKAFGKALDSATRLDPRITDVLSTKGTI